MCGVPFHSAKHTSTGWSEKGYKVAICEQMEDAFDSRPCKRDVIRVVTSGTVIEQSMLDERRTAICCHLHGRRSGELSLRGCFDGRISAIRNRRASVRLQDEIVRMMPKEIIANTALPEDDDAACRCAGRRALPLSPARVSALLEHFKVKSLDTLASAG